MWADLTNNEKNDVWHCLVACTVSGILGLFMLAVFTVLPQESRPVTEKIFYTPPYIEPCHLPVKDRVAGKCERDKQVQDDE